MHSHKSANSFLLFRIRNHAVTWGNVLLLLYKNSVAHQFSAKNNESVVVSTKTLVKFWFEFPFHWLETIWTKRPRFPGLKWKSRLWIWNKRLRFTGLKRESQLGIETKCSRLTSLKRKKQLGIWTKRFSFHQLKRKSQLRIWTKITTKNLN